MVDAKDKSFFYILNEIISQYRKTTSKKLKLIDAFLLYTFITGITQLVYVLLVGTFPKNSFLSGFIVCVAMFVLAGKLKYY